MLTLHYIHYSPLHMLLSITYMCCPTQSIICIPFLVNKCHKSISLILQYKYLKSFSEDFILKNPKKIGFSAQDHAVLLILLNIVGFFISARQMLASSFPPGRNLPGGNDLYHSCTSIEEASWRGHPLNIFT